MYDKEKSNSTQSIMSNIRWEKMRKPCIFENKGEKNSG